MKFIYVITSSERDYYLEQAIVSIYSLLLHNPLAEVIMITDENTLNHLEGNRKRILEYLSDIISIKLPEKLTPLQKSRFLKTNLRSYIKGDYWFIDTDTIITEHIPEILDKQIHVAAVLDKHLPINEHTGRSKIQKYAKIVDWKIPNDFKYFNSGVMFVRDSIKAHELYNMWHKIWLHNSEKNDLNIDQPSLAKANEETNYLITELPGIYNCQLIENGLSYLSGSIIIHYFASSVDSSWDCPYKFRNKKVYETIREKGITPEIEDMIVNARSQFIPKCTIIGGQQTDTYFTPIMGIARRIARKYPWINLCLEKFFMFIGRI